MEFIYSYIKNICVFTLVTTLILNIFPDRQYKKYIKLFVGILLLALIFNPLVKLRDSKIDLNKIISDYTHGSYEIELDKDVMELETKMYERISDGYKDNAEQNEE